MTNDMSFERPRVRHALPAMHPPAKAPEYIAGPPLPFAAGGGNVLGLTGARLKGVGNGVGEMAVQVTESQTSGRNTRRPRRISIEPSGGQQRKSRTGKTTVDGSVNRKRTNGSKAKKSLSEAQKAVLKKHAFRSKKQ